MVDLFLQCFGLYLNVIELVELEFTYFDVTTQCIKYYATETPVNSLECNKLMERIVLYI